MELDRHDGLLQIFLSLLWNIQSSRFSLPFVGVTLNSRYQLPVWRFATAGPARGEMLRHRRRCVAENKALLDREARKAKRRFKN